METCCTSKWWRPRLNCRWSRARVRERREGGLAEWGWAGRVPELLCLHHRRCKVRGPGEPGVRAVRLVRAWRLYHLRRQLTARVDWAALRAVASEAVLYGV